MLATFSGRSCIIGPAVVSSSSLGLLSCTKPKENRLNDHRRPIPSGAAQIFPSLACLVICVAQLKLSFLLS